MKSLFPSSSKSIETVRLNDDYTCDVYTWVSPEGVKIAAHMIFACPECSYPLSLATSEFDFDEKTLRHKVRCPARWKKTSHDEVNGIQIQVTELNEKGRPIFQKCGWSGYIHKGRLISEDY